MVRQRPASRAETSRPSVLGRPVRKGRVSRWLRPRVWLPFLVLGLVAVFLAEVVEPWPEGRILLTLHGLGPHGITVSDVVVLGAVAVLGAGWLRLTTGREEGVDPSVPGPPDTAHGAPQAGPSTGSR